MSIWGKDWELKKNSLPLEMKKMLYLDLFLCIFAFQFVYICQILFNRSLARGVLYLWLQPLTEVNSLIYADKWEASVDIDVLKMLHCIRFEQFYECTEG